MNLINSLLIKIIYHKRQYDNSPVRSNHGLSTQAGQTPLQLWYTGVIKNAGIHTGLTETIGKFDIFIALMKKDHHPKFKAIIML